MSAEPIVDTTVTVEGVVIHHNSDTPGSISIGGWEMSLEGAMRVRAEIGNVVQRTLDAAAEEQGRLNEIRDELHGGES